LVTFVEVLLWIRGTVSTFVYTLGLALLGFNKCLEEMYMFVSTTNKGIYEL
jgi:hypothetical protein